MLWRLLREVGRVSRRRADDGFTLLSSQEGVKGVGWARVAPHWLETLLWGPLASGCVSALLGDKRDLPAQCRCSRAMGGPERLRNNG